jgi:hypothetical protein
MNIAVDCRTLGASAVGVYLRECLHYVLDSPHNIVYDYWRRAFWGRMTISTVL